MKTFLVKLFSVIFSTDSLPVIGGAGGALSQISQTNAIPSSDVFIYTFIIAAFGAIIGYGVKLILDFIVGLCKKRK